MIIPKGTVVTIDGKVYRTLEAQVAWNKEELESLDIEALEALPDQFTELQENVSALADSVADVTEDVGGLESDMTDAQSDISGLKTRMTTAETNIGTNAGEISQLQFDLGQAQGDITALGNSKLNKPTNTGEVGDVIVKTANGTEYQSVAPFNPNGTYPNVTAGKAISAKSLENVSEDSGATQTAPFFFQAAATANNTTETPTAPVFKLKSLRGNTIVYNQLVDGVTQTYPTISGHVYWFKHDPLISLVTSTGTDINVPTPQSDKLVDLIRWFNGSIPQAILDDPTVFPVNYYDGELTYSAGELKNCSCTELKTVGFNQWDEEWELGSINSSGENVSSSSEIRGKNYYDCLEQTDYFCNQGNDVVIYFYDQAKNHIPYVGWGAYNGGYNGNRVFTTPVGTRYFRFRCASTYGTTYKNDICINLSWDGERDGEYAPYTPHTYPLVWSGKSAGNQTNFVCDERLPDGTETQNITTINLSDYVWTYDTSTDPSRPRFYSTQIPSIKNGSKVTCDLFIYDDRAISVMGIGTIKFTDRFYVVDPSCTDIATFNAKIANATANAELATPVATEGTPYTSEIEGDDYGTMSFDSVVPVGNEFFYPADYSLLIDDLGNYTGYDVTKLAKKTDLIPAPTGGDGTYVLKATVSGGAVTYSWEAES